MFPGRGDLLSLILRSIELTLAKLDSNGVVMTDTFSTLQKFYQLLIATIRELCEEQGLPPEEISYSREIAGIIYAIFGLEQW